MSALIKSATLLSGIGLTGAAVLFSSSRAQTDFSAPALKVSELDSTLR